MDLRCPKCNSTDLKKVSLAHEEGLFQNESRTRLRAVVVGGGGPDLVVGKATTRGTHQSAPFQEAGTTCEMVVSQGHRMVRFWCFSV